jgi:small-conductance mechanosensitive channel
MLQLYHSGGPDYLRWAAVDATKPFWYCPSLWVPPAISAARQSLWKTDAVFDCARCAPEPQRRIDMKRMIVWLWATGLIFAVTAVGRQLPKQTGTASQAQAAWVPQSGGRMATLVSSPAGEKGGAQFKGSMVFETAGALFSSHHLTPLLRRLVITAFVLGVALLLLIALGRLRKRATAFLEEKRERIPTFRFRGLELVSAQTLIRNADWVLRGIYVLALTLVVLGAGLLVFGQFPATQGYVRQVVLWLWNPIVAIFHGMLGYLPNLFYILVIVMVTRFIVRMINYVFGAAERGLISLEPWIHRDVARPTGLIIKVVVVVVALFFIAPLVPGTGSTAAKGVSIILGLMISFGSTTTIGNLVAGVGLMYMRPFRQGERVRIGETVGDVIERTFLYTKVLTIKNEEVIVPSLTAFGSPIVNYSARAQAQGLILHTSVTIGYDAPWRQVHELLLRAAEQTSHVAKEPKPFVLQTALNDFYVGYEINAYTNQPVKMAQIYSELHQNIQDRFNEAGVEICSPHYRQLRDGNTTTIPTEYRPKNYESPRFQVESHPIAAGR